MLRVAEVNWSQAAPALRAVRERVFVVEQGIDHEEEWDGLDDDARHFLATLDGTPVGTARLLPTGQIGRMAVLAEHRRLGIGRLLLDAAVDCADRLGHAGVFLHAQRTAEPFYAAAGFRADGDTFLEAGIAHVNMTKALALAYEPVAVPEAAPTRPPRPARARSSVRPVRGDAALRDAVVQVASQARRALRISSVRLEPAVFDQVELEALVSALARRHAQCFVRILVTDPKSLAGSPHRLLTLARRLSSAVQIRVPRNLPAEGLDLLPTYVVADDSALFTQPHTNASEGFYDLEGGALARSRAQDFDDAWARAIEHAELRQLRL